LTGQPGGARLDRTGAVAIRDAAIHAARGLVAGVLLAQRNDEFAIVLHAVIDRRILAIMPVDFREKPVILPITPLRLLLRRCRHFRDAPSAQTPESRCWFCEVPGSRFARSGTTPDDVYRPDRDLRFGVGRWPSIFLQGAAVFPPASPCGIFGSHVFQFARISAGLLRAGQLGVTRDQDVQPLDVGFEQVLEHVDPGRGLRGRRCG